MKYYAVQVGKKTGIYTSWDECSLQVQGYPGAKYKSFNDIGSAQSYLGELSVQVTEQKWDETCTEATFRLPDGTLVD